MNAKALAERRELYRRLDELQGDNHLRPRVQIDPPVYYIGTAAVTDQAIWSKDYRDTRWWHVTPLPMSLYDHGTQRMLMDDFGTLVPAGGAA